MKITVKVRAPAGKAPASVVRDRLKQLGRDAEIEEVFPGETTGRRAGLVLIDLPDDVSDEDSDRVLQALRKDAAVEYAEPASQREPKRPGKRPSH